jgi:flagellar basal body-associated protein FliL
MGESSEEDESASAKLESDCSSTAFVVVIVILVLIILALVGYIYFIKNSKFNAVVQERADNFLNIAPISRRSRLFRHSCIGGPSPDDDFVRKPKVVTFQNAIDEEEAHADVESWEIDESTAETQSGQPGGDVVHYSVKKCEGAEPERR